MTYLRKLTSADTASAASTARDTVATVFKGVGIGRAADKP